jgi:NAD(P)-dependent dehydrogenase (short-subunit alcohol dehydrogenase family)
MEYISVGKLTGKKALIIGGDSGIGRAVAKLYAKEGADVTIVHLPEEEEDAKETKKMVEASGGKCITLSFDLVVSPSGRVPGRLVILARLGGDPWLIASKP